MLQKFRRSSKRCNQTCVQNAQLYLTFHEAGEWRRGARSPWVCFRRQKSVMPEDVRALAAYTHARMQRVAGMMAVLLALHDDWAISPHRDYVKMETTTLEYNIIVDALLAAGYTADDFILQTEYTRKWGML